MTTIGLQSFLKKVLKMCLSVMFASPELFCKSSHKWDVLILLIIFYYHNNHCYLEYFGIGKGFIKDLQLITQLQCVNKVILVSCGYLHQTTESLERPVWMVLWSEVRIILTNWVNSNVWMRSSHDLWIIAVKIRLAITHTLNTRLCKCI